MHLDTPPSLRHYRLPLHWKRRQHSSPPPQAGEEGQDLTMVPDVCWVLVWDWEEVSEQRRGSSCTSSWSTETKPTSLTNSLGRPILPPPHSSFRVFDPVEREESERKSLRRLFLFLFSFFSGENRPSLFFCFDVFGSNPI